MKLLRLQSMIVVLACVLVISGCAQKKPVLVAPQQLPPTVAPETTPTPEPTAESQSAEKPQEAQQTPATTDQTTKAAEKTQPKNNHHSATRKPPAPAASGTEVAHNTTTKKVIPADKPGAPATSTGGQISPGPTSSDAAHSQTSTEQLLQSTESNLNSIKRQLSKDEEAMRAQIREFINQSRKATTENDLARAHNFALKARLLSDELVKIQ